MAWLLVFPIAPTLSLSLSLSNVSGVKRPTGHVAVCDYMLQRGSLRKGRVDGWGCWGGGGGRLERERRVILLFTKFRCMFSHALAFRFA